MEKVLAFPEQLFAVGVTVILANAAIIVVLVAVNAAILPVPEAPSPMLELSFVQLYVVPLTVPV